MKIKLNDKLELESDQYQFWFNILRITKKGKGAGDERREPQGYYPNIESALHRLADKMIRRSEATTLEQFGKDIQQVHEEIKELCEVMRKELATEVKKGEKVRV